MEYKFRALRSEFKTSKWVYGSLITTPDGAYILEEGDNVEYSEPEYHKVGMGCGLEDQNITDRYEAMQHGWDCALEKCCETFPPFLPIILETVGICFGWVDSDNKDIYTGDQLEILWLSGQKTCEVISYSKEYGYFMYGNNPVCELVEAQIRSKVIGNIHEHPHLNPGSGQSAINNMLLDPNTQQAEEVKEQAAGQVAAVEQEAQEQAMESEETEG